MKTQNPPSSLLPAIARTGILIGVSAASLFIAGCASEPESHVVSAPPPPPPQAAATVTTTTVPAGTTAATTASGTPIIVNQAPPVLQTEPVLERPTPKHVWLPGYWSYREGRYVWIAGRWEVPPSSSSVWVPPHWESESNGYRFYEGYWK